ncbi:MAG: preprotein translocase subunit SecE [Thermoleophilia bacterium]
MVQQRRGSRFITEVVAELRKVSWPTRTQLMQSTAVVLVVVAIVSLYLWALDSVFSRLVDAIF